MKNLIRIILICSIVFLHDIDGLRRRCNNTGVFFVDKILHSSIIVYGESLAKEIYLETETELLFNITFRVDCIFRGRDIENNIEITDAGIQLNRTACQWLDPGNFYVVFLEKCGTNVNTYCPLDFQERIVDNITYELLEKTCDLTRVQPLHSISDNCPNISMPEFCPNDEMDVKIIPKTKSLDYTKTSFNVTNQFYPQSNVTMPKDGLLVNQFADNPSNHTGLSQLISVWIIILAVSSAMSFF